MIKNVPVDKTNMAESQLGEAFICEDSKGELVQELLKYGIYGEETTLELPQPRKV